MNLNKVAIFLPSRSRNVSGDLDTIGTGMREQVADWLADSLAKNEGCEVHVFTNQEEGSQHYAPWDLHYVDHQMAGPMLLSYDWDAVISFDYPSITQLENLHENVGKVIIAQNYFEIPPDGIVSEEFLDLVDTWVYPSQFAHHECSIANGIYPAKGVVIPYTWDNRFFSYKNHLTAFGKDQLRFIYANQAESGLAQMLHMWPRLRDEFPNSILTVATPVDEFVEQIQWSHSIQSELALDIRDLISQDGVRYIGRQGRPALAREFANSDYLLYPAEPLMPSEIGSLPLIQAVASGVIPIFRDVDALSELYGDYGHCVPKDANFKDYLLNTLLPAEMRNDLMPDHSDQIYEKWLKVIN